MNDLLIELVHGRTPTEKHLHDALFEVCDDEHASCGYGCPVYALNGGKAPDTAGDFEVNLGCDCFKDGRKMAEFIRSHS